MIAWRSKYKEMWSLKSWLKQNQKWTHKLSNAHIVRTETWTGMVWGSIFRKSMEASLVSAQFVFKRIMVIQTMFHQIFSLILNLGIDAIMMSWLIEIKMRMKFWDKFLRKAKMISDFNYQYLYLFFFNVYLYKFTC